MDKKIVLLILLFFAAGCATSNKAKDFQGGFSEERISSDEFLISFEGNTSLDSEALESSLMSRASEITLQNGFSHFLVIGKSSNRSLGFVMKPGEFGPVQAASGSIRIQCFFQEPQGAGAIDARQFLGSCPPATGSRFPKRQSL